MCKLENFIGKKYLIYNTYVIRVDAIENEDEVLCTTWKLHLKDEQKNKLNRKFFEDLLNTLPQLEYKGE